MKGISGKWMLTGILSICLLGGSIGQARAEGDTEEIQGVTVAQSELSPSARSLLTKAGVRGTEVSIQPFAEYTLVSDGVNWSITEEGSENGLSPKNIDFGGGVCKGGFLMPKKVNANIEWGAWNDCTTFGKASTYVHSISAQLWMQTGAFAFQKTYQAVAVSPLDAVSSKVVTAHRAKGCDTSYKKEFQIRAEVTLKSKKMGVVKSDNVTLPCNFKVK